MEIRCVSLYIFVQLECSVFLDFFLSFPFFRITSCSRYFFFEIPLSFFIYFFGIFSNISNFSEFFPNYLFFGYLFSWKFLFRLKLFAFLEFVYIGSQFSFFLELVSFSRNFLFFLRIVFNGFYQFL